MTNRLARLLRRPHRESPRDPTADSAATSAGPTVLEADEWEPTPVLLPAAIIRQVLVDATEFPPAWLKPRPAPAPEPAIPVAAEAAAAKPAKRPRRPRSTAPSASAPASTPTKPRTKRTTRAKTDPSGT